MTYFEGVLFLNIIETKCSMFFPLTATCRGVYRQWERHHVDNIQHTHAHTSLQPGPALPQQEDSPTQIFHHSERLRGLCAGQSG